MEVVVLAITGQPEAWASIKGQPNPLAEGRKQKGLGLSVEHIEQAMAGANNREEPIT